MAALEIFYGIITKKYLNDTKLIKRQLEYINVIKKNQIQIQIHERLQFLSTNKEKKKKKWLIKDKVRIENTEMRVMKNDNMKW